MADDTTITPAAHVAALRGIARVIAAMAEYARVTLDAGDSVDDLITITATHSDDHATGLALGAFLYLANVVNLGPDDLLDLATEILDQLPDKDGT